MSERARVQRKKDEAERQQAPQLVQETLGSGGQPLDATTRAAMEPRFGHDFSHVQVHADEQASQSAQAIQARAYTVGNDVVFGAGEYAPETSDGQRLIAHELAHVVQQSQGLVSGVPIGNELTVSEPGDVFEDAAKHSAAQISQAGPAQIHSLVNIPSSTSSTFIQRQEKTEDEGQNIALGEDEFQETAPEQEDTEEALTEASSKDSDGNRFHSSSLWNSGTTLSVRGGQVMHFEITNLNILGTTIEIKAQNGDVRKSIIGPKGTVDLTFTMFGREPSGWTFDISTVSDVFLVGWNLYSSWIPGDQPNG